MSSNMQSRSNVRSLCARVHTIMHIGNRKSKQALDISAPFDFKHIPISIPGISEDEVSMLREKAAASRIGVAETLPQTPLSTRSQTSTPTATPLSSHTTQSSGGFF